MNKNLCDEACAIVNGQVTAQPRLPILRGFAIPKQVERVSSSACARLVVFQSEQRQGRQALPLDPYCRARIAGGRVKLTCMQLACMHACHKYTEAYCACQIWRRELRNV